MKAINPVKIVVVKSPDKKGYSLQHNQKKGWSGTIRPDNIWAWFKYRTDAEQSAFELNTFYNK